MLGYCWHVVEATFVKFVMNYSVEYMTNHHWRLYSVEQRVQIIKFFFSKSVLRLRNNFYPRHMPSRLFDVWWLNSNQPAR